MPRIRYCLRLLEEKAQTFLYTKHCPECTSGGMTTGLIFLNFGTLDGTEETAYITLDIHGVCVLCSHISLHKLPIHEGV